jgi:hypothetical protein
MLFIPEALSFSRLNWFNIVDAGYILSPIRDYSQVFLTGIVIITGYSVLVFTARYRANMREYIERGVEYNQVEEIIGNQAVLSFVCGVFSAVSVVLVSMIVPIFKQKLIQSIITLPYPYLILGIVASLCVFFWNHFMLESN